jgi:hypothetical protein
MHIVLNHQSLYILFNTLVVREGKTQEFPLMIHRMNFFLIVFCVFHHHDLVDCWVNALLICRVVHTFFIRGVGCVSDQRKI